MKEPKAAATRCYVHGVEVNRIRPRLEFLDDDDWFDKLVPWIKEKHGDDDIFAVMDKNPDKHADARLVSLWVGVIPNDYLIDIPDEKCIREFTFGDLEKGR